MKLTASKAAIGTCFGVVAEALTLKTFNLSYWPTRNPLRNFLVETSLLFFQHVLERAVHNPLNIPEVRMALQ
jgi:hypothetical protein